MSELKCNRDEDMCIKQRGEKGTYICTDPETEAMKQEFKAKYPNGRKVTFVDNKEKKLKNLSYQL